MIEIDESNFASEIIDSNGACLVYFTTLDKGVEIKEEFKFVNKMTRFLNGAIKLGVFRIDKADSKMSEIRKKYKLTSKFGVDKPELRFYPNEV